MVVLYGPTGRFTAANDGFRPGQDFAKPIAQSLITDLWMLEQESRVENGRNVCALSKSTRAYLLAQVVPFFLQYNVRRALMTPPFSVFGTPKLENLSAAPVSHVGALSSSVFKSYVSRAGCAAAG